MSESVTEAQSQSTTPPATAPKLEDLLADLTDDARKAVLGEVTKARNEAKGLRSRVREAEPALQRLAALEAATQTEAERQAAALTEATRRAEQAEQSALRASVALAKGLPANLAARLQGTDQASLEADADELLTLIPQDTAPRTPRPDLSQGSSSKGAGVVTPAEQFAAIVKQQLG